MTNTQTISIDEDLWDDAKETYDNVSGKISELLDEDLERNSDKQRPADIIKNSSLTDRQKQVAKEMIKEGISEKTGTQMSSFLESKGFNRSDYRRKFKNAIDIDEKIPFEKGEDRGSVQATDYLCDCDCVMTPKTLSQNDGECLTCGRRIVDLGESE